MITTILNTPLELKPEHTKILSGHLLNSWSAEYALNITPLVNDDNKYLENSIHWTFPQAYYSALFSARAVLFVSGVIPIGEDNVFGAMQVLAACGLYNDDYQEGINLRSYDLKENLFAEIRQYRTPDSALYQISKEELLSFHIQLCERTQRIACYHEAYIRQIIGPEAYRRIVKATPDYLHLVVERERIYADLTVPEIA